MAGTGERRERFPVLRYEKREIIQEMFILS